MRERSFDTRRTFDAKKTRGFSLVVLAGMLCSGCARINIEASYRSVLWSGSATVTIEPATSKGVSQ